MLQYASSRQQGQYAAAPVCNIASIPTAFLMGVNYPNIAGDLKILRLICNTSNVQDLGRVVRPIRPF